MAKIIEFRPKRTLKPIKTPKALYWIFWAWIALVSGVLIFSNYFEINRAVSVLLQYIK